MSRTFTMWGHVILTKMLIPTFCSIFLPLNNEQDNKIKTKEALTQQYHDIKILQKLGKSKMKIYSSYKNFLHTLRYLSTRILKISKMNWSSLLKLYYMWFASSYLITWTKSLIFSSLFWNWYHQTWSQRLQGMSSTVRSLICRSTITCR